MTEHCPFQAPFVILHMENPHGRVGAGSETSGIPLTRGKEANQWGKLENLSRGRERCSALFCAPFRASGVEKDTRWSMCGTCPVLSIGCESVGRSPPGDSTAAFFVMGFHDRCRLLQRISRLVGYFDLDSMVGSDCKSRDYQTGTPLICVDEI